MSKFPGRMEDLTTFTDNIDIYIKCTVGDEVRHFGCEKSALEKHPSFQDLIKAKPGATLIDVRALGIEETLAALLCYLHYGYLPRWSVEDDIMTEFPHYATIFQDAMVDRWYGLAESAIRALDKEIYMNHNGPSDPSDVLGEIYDMQLGFSEEYESPGGLVKKFKRTVMRAQAENLVKALGREKLQKLDAKYPGFFLDLTDGLREKMAAE